MRKYKVVGVMHTNFVAIVEAESEEEASRIARRTVYGLKLKMVETGTLII